MNPLLPIIDLVLMGNNDSIITIIIGNNNLVIVQNNYKCNNICNNE